MAVTKEILTLAVETGDALLRNGAEVYRVEDTVLHILKAYEITDCDVYVLSNGIFASANENKEDACSMIRHVPLGSTHLGRIAALNQLSREICSHECSLRDAWVRLEECKSIPKNKNWVEIFFCGVGSAGFCYLFGGTALDSFVAFFIGLVLQIFLIASDRHLESKFITNILGSGIVTFLSLIVLSAGIPIRWRGRCYHALPACHRRCITSMIIQFLVSLAATLSFAVLFSAEKKQLFFCGLTGALGWIVYMICLQYHTDNAIANLIATFALTLVARILSAVRRTPVTVFLLTGIFPLVPGAGIYYTSYYFIMGDMSRFSQYGISTVKVAGSIVLGIIFGFALPQSLFNGLSKLAHKD